MKFINEKFNYSCDKTVCGLTKELIALYINNYFINNDENIIVLVSNLYEANNYYKMFSEYNDSVLLFPMDDFLTSVALAISPDFKLKRLDTINKIKSGKKNIIITSLMGYLKFLPNISEKQKLTIKGYPLNISREIILNTLNDFGYEKVSIVSKTGEYAVRGYIIDIFPIDYDHPFRIEFFGDEIDNIREFDENTQMSIKNIQEFNLFRFNETTNKQPSSLLEYTNKKTVFMIDENQIRATYQQLQKEIFEYNNTKNINKKYMFELNEINPNIIYKINSINYVENKNSLIYTSKEIENFNSNFSALESYCRKNISKNIIIFLTNNSKQTFKIKEIFDDAIITNDRNINKDKINIIESPLKKGFIFDNYIIIGPNDIENNDRKTIKYRNPIKYGYQIKSFNDLSIGDYIVHENYGIGIYNGLKTLKKGDYEMDYIQLLYAGNDKVYVQVENIQKLYKYSDKNGTIPKINKLNSTTWTKKKLEARKKIEDISEELLELYTKRSKLKIDPYKDYSEELEFGLSFPYTLTRDQEKCINEINEDLKKNYPMDRLLCGDVGFGKTEVAFRAMFKTILNNKSVAYLCPTTILSKQQYNSAIERFKNFPVRIELINRYITTKKFNQICKDLENGKIDIIIGTHKLLNKNIKFKNLGLLIVDEEQRFGVKHKEKIKSIKSDINVLTLSATPIPRTLKMAMSGIRNLSVLDTPPSNRYPVETYLLEQNDLIIREAIYKELSRNGQIYILINNIDEMDNLINKIKDLVPESRITKAHGKMSNEEINQVMESFISYKYDILVCTTIIETGIDISNANTIIIIDADKFGLSQLYQIRGRVGRSDRIAYSYLMYNPRKVLNEIAIKRLNSIKEFTQLGSGYKIAMRDLSIRGAGDLLGKEQAGFIDSIGIDLYTKMINEQINNKNVELEEKEENKTGPLFNISNHIDDEYVEDEDIKIQIHALINGIKTQKDFNNVKKELEDRFGKINKKIEIYMIEKCIENMIEKLNIKEIHQSNNNVCIILPEELSSKIDGEKLFIELYSINSKFKISYRNKKISIELNTNLLQNNYIYYIFDLLNSIYHQIN